ncbi:MAG TPA: hypothetical protein VFV50_10660, partial [Bdellovibrionales bacterium]|nr:hypothetical protein [Bdellovibrionales bacterium]
KNESMGQSAHAGFEVRRLLATLPLLVKPDDAFAWETSLPVRLEWKSVEGAEKYRVTVARDRDLKQVVKSVTISGSPYAWAWSQPGAYYWAVESLDRDNQAFTRSLVRAFTTKAKESSEIALLLPENKSEVNRERKEPMDPVSFEWKADRLQPSNYTLMISKTPGFEKFLKTENIDKNRVTVRLPESATYYWKVIWADPAAPDKTETSPTFTLVYNIAPGLPSPQLLEPARDAIQKITDPKPVEFTWTPVEKAAKYRVVIERFDERLNGRTPVSDSTVTEAKLVSKPLSEGLYEWKVYTIDDKNIQGLPSETRKLHVKTLELLMAPKLKPLEIK